MAAAPEKGDCQYDGEAEDQEHVVGEMALDEVKSALILDRQLVRVQKRLAVLAAEMVRVLVVDGQLFLLFEGSLLFDGSDRLFH